MIPIMIDHNQHEIIGFASVVNDRLHIKFKNDMRITKEVLKNTFGNIGFLAIQCHEEDGEIFFREIQILEWSFGACAWSSS